MFFVWPGQQKKIKDRIELFEIVSGERAMRRRTFDSDLIFFLWLLSWLLEYLKIYMFFLRLFDTTYESVTGTGMFSILSCKGVYLLSCSKCLLLLSLMFLLLISAFLLSFFLNSSFHTFFWMAFFGLLFFRRYFLFLSGNGWKKKEVMFCCVSIEISYSIDIQNCRPFYFSTFLSHFRSIFCPHFFRLGREREDGKHDLLIGCVVQCPFYIVNELEWV